jgi:hypothetical protein
VDGEGEPSVASARARRPLLGGSALRRRRLESRISSHRATRRAFSTTRQVNDNHPGTVAHDHRRQRTAAPRHGCLTARSEVVRERRCTARRTGKPVEVRRGPATVAGEKGPARRSHSRASRGEGSRRRGRSGCSLHPGSQETSLRAEAANGSRPTVRASEGDATAMARLASRIPARLLADARPRAPRIAAPTSRSPGAPGRAQAVVRGRPRPSPVPRSRRRPSDGRRGARAGRRKGCQLLGRRRAWR